LRVKDLIVVEVESDGFDLIVVEVESDEISSD
jgi:hypothetical protein